MAKRILSIDSGSSICKALSADQRDRFPSAVRRVDADSDWGDTLTVDGVRYVVGESALRTYTGVDAQEPYVRGGFHGSTDQYVQMCYAMQRLGAAGDYDALIVSLPYADSKHEATKQVLRGRTDYVWSDARGKDHAVHFGQVLVLPQGVGAMVRYECERETRPQTLVLVDIGSCTIDQVVMRYSADKRQYLYLHDKSQSRRTLNVTAFYRHWLDRIRNLDGMQELVRGYHQLMNLAVLGVHPMTLRHEGREVDVTASYRLSRRWFTEEVERALKSDVGASLLAEVDQIVITGGGAQLLDATETLLGGRVECLSVWANVEGQYIEAMGRRKDATVAQVAQIPMAAGAR